MDGSRSERGLILASQKNDNVAFGELVKIHAEKIYNLCYRLSGNYDDANDLTQDVFLRAYKGIKYFNLKSSFSTWVHKIAVNLWINLAKRRKKIKFISIDKPIKYKDSEKSMHDIIPGGINLH